MLNLRKNLAEFRCRFPEQHVSLYESPTYRVQALAFTAYCSKQQNDKVDLHCI
jgi:hypothetical protein